MGANGAANGAANANMAANGAANMGANGAANMGANGAVNMGANGAVVGGPVVSSSFSSSPPNLQGPRPPKGPLYEKPDLADIWDDLFTVSRTSSCAPEASEQSLNQALQEEELRKRSMDGGEILDYDSSFTWIKKWGFGPVAYFIDFLDPLFREPALKEFNCMWKNITSEVPEDTAEYRDAFDFANRIKTAPLEKQSSILRDIKKLEKSYDPIIYENSVNSVQLHKAIKNFRWVVDAGSPDFAADFIMQYDINHDGRLNPRELILGAIRHNQQNLGSKKCNHCFTEVSRMLKGLFTYIDCSDSGFVDADHLWKNLPSLNRKVAKWNIFKYGNNENIRSNAVNDFILKNQRSRDAAVSKQEFIAGILLGIWDRQTTEHGILLGDERSLKTLRWTDNDMVDTNAFSYVKAVAQAKIDEQLRELAAKKEAEELLRKQRQLDYINMRK